MLNLTVVNLEVFVTTTNIFTAQVLILIPNITR